MDDGHDDADDGGWRMDDDSDDCDCDTDTVDATPIKPYQ